jgi:hypothetical protein
MSNGLSKALDVTKSAFGIVRAVGPWIIARADKLSEAAARHEGRLAVVAVAKELLIEEVRVHGDFKKHVHQQLVSADAITRIRLQRELRDADASIRALIIGEHALDYFASASETAERGKRAIRHVTKSDDPDVSEHWMDRFLELARSHNEPWRTDLLARALARETSLPGSVPIRVLWLIGTLEQRQFEAFSVLIHLCTDLDGALAVPNWSEFLFRPIPASSLESDTALAHLHYQLGDTGLIADSHSAHEFNEGVRFTAAYGSRQIAGTPTVRFQTNGLLLSVLGNDLASFCDRKPNALGEEIFARWLASVPIQFCPIEVMS